MKIKLTETRSFIKAVIVIIIAVAVAVPAAYMLFNPTGATQTTRYIASAQGTTPRSPDPDPTPEPDDNDDEQTVFSSGGSSTGGSGSPGSGTPSDDGNDDNDNCFSKKDLMIAEYAEIPPDFLGDWGEGVYDENPIGPLKGYIVLYSRSVLNPDGTYTHIRDEIGFMFMGSGARIKMLLNEDGTFTGTIKYDGDSGDITGEYEITLGVRESVQSIFSANFDWDDGTYWVYGDYLRQNLPPFPE